MAKNGQLHLAQIVVHSTGDLHNNNFADYIDNDSQHSYSIALVHYYNPMGDLSCNYKENSLKNTVGRNSSSSKV